MTVEVVSEFSSRLLRITQGFFGRAPWEQIKPLLLERVERPPGLAPAAMRLLQDTLAKGCVLRLARGGWRQERFLADDSIAASTSAGRLWQRHSLDRLTLRFSPNSVDFLMWCTATPITGAKVQWNPDRRHPLTLGDLLLLYIAYDAVRHTTTTDVFRRQAAIASHPLCRLAFPEDSLEAAEPIKPIDFGSWLTSPGSIVLEALQYELAAAWCDLEQRKQSIHSPAMMRSLGRAQSETLRAFMTAANAAHRRDLARFVLIVAQRLLRRPSSWQTWVQSLDIANLRLADRMEAYRAALALPRLLLTLDQWRREAAGIGYTDEQYAAAQLFKSDWERFDADRLCRHARELLRACEALR